MELTVTEKGNQNLYVYQNDKLLFYSIIKFNFFKSNVIKIFGQHDELILEVKCPQWSINASYKIVNQKGIAEKINKINYDEILFDQTKRIHRRKKNIFSLNLNSLYFSDKIQIAEVKQKMWSLPQKMLIKINDDYLEFLNIIILHILATRTEQLEA